MANRELPGLGRGHQPSRTSVKDLIADQPVASTYLVQSKEKKTAQTGSAYLDLELRDATGIIKGKLWDCERHNLDFQVDDVVRVEGLVELYRGAPQLKIRRISRCAPDDVNLLDFLPRSERDPDEMLAALRARLGGLAASPLRALLISVFDDPAIGERYKLAPAATAFHHAYLGGLIEHVLSLVELGDRICDHYAALDRDLVLAGLLLHDVGKIEELRYDRAFDYTTRGRLIGHITIGLEIVRDKIRAIPDFPAALQERLEHIILSHHGQLEFGSPRLPMFPEALVVHVLDDLDAKLASMRATYEADQERPGDWTTRNRALGRELLKNNKDSGAGD